MQETFIKARESTRERRVTSASLYSRVAESPTPSIELEIDRHVLRSEKSGGSTSSGNEAST